VENDIRRSFLVDRHLNCVALGLISLDLIGIRAIIRVVSPGCRRRPGMMVGIFERCAGSATAGCYCHVRYSSRC
jgi:hypothetical protein